MQRFPICFANGKSYKEFFNVCTGKRLPALIMYSEIFQNSKCTAANNDAAFAINN